MSTRGMLIWAGALVLGFLLGGLVGWSHREHDRLGARRVA